MFNVGSPFSLYGLPAVIDVEASGLGRGSYPIEIGLVTSDGLRHCTLIRPEPHWTHWDERAEALHGISRRLLATHGCASAEVAETLNRRALGQTVYSDAWGNDISWLGRLFDTAGLPMRFKLESICTLLDATMMERWNRTKRELIARVGAIRHRASTDALIIQMTCAILHGADVDALVCAALEPPEQVRFAATG